MVTFRQDASDARRSLHSAGYSKAALALILLTWLTSSCSVKFVSDYDEKLDSAVTDLHTTLDAFLIKQAAESGTPAGEYDNNQEFYANTEAAISSIRMRAESSQKNELTVQQIGTLQNTFDDLRKLHRQRGKAGLNADLVQKTRSAFDSECTAITQFELAKKRGK
jgi:hypothetical protein